MSDAAFTDKRGTANWVQCPATACRQWFHVSSALLARGDVALHCPHCHHEFAPAAAARTVKGGS